MGVGDWLTIAEAAELAGVSKATLRRWDRTGRLPATRHPVSGYRIYLRDHLQDLRPPPTEPTEARLLGRSAEVEAVESASASRRLVVLTGPPGIGKSRLLRHVLERRTDAVAVDCSDVTDLDGFRDAVGRALSVSTGGLDRRIAVLDGLLGLDNLEQLVDEGVPEQLARWLDEAPRMRIAATSREATRLPREHVVPLGPLDLDSARALFRRHSRTEWTDAQIDALVERLEGNPLALELAASQTRMLAPDELLARLGPDLLATDLRGIPERQANIVAAVRSSMDRLTDRERRALSSLTVFRGGFTVSAAAAVLGVDDALPILRALERASLLRTWASRGRRRLAPWVIVREVVQATDPPGPHASARLARWLAELPIRDARDEVENVRAVLGDATVPPELRARLLTGPAALVRRIQITEQLDVARALLREVDDPDLRAGLYATVSIALVSTAEPDAARREAERGLALPCSDETRARLLVMLAYLDPERQYEHLDTALQVAEQTGRDALLARVYAMEANVRIRDRDPRSAIKALRRYAQLARRAGDPEEEAVALVRTTRIEMVLGVGHLDDSLRALALSEDLSIPRLHAFALHTVGMLLLESNQVAQGVSYLEQAREVWDHTGEQLGAARARAAVSVGYLLAGRVDVALRDLERARPALEDFEYDLEKVQVLRAVALQLAGQPSRALDALPADPVSDVAYDVGQLVRRLQGAPAEARRSSDDEDVLVRLLQRLVGREIRQLSIAPDGSRFEAPGHPPCDLSTRPVLARVLEALATAEAPLSAAELASATWPDERLVGDSGERRIRSAVWKLRRLGLAEYLRTTPQGYQIAPSDHGESAADW